jgi:hypothetical protein
MYVAKRVAASFQHVPRHNKSLMRSFVLSTIAPFLLRHQPLYSRSSAGGGVAHPRRRT